MNLPKNGSRLANGLIFVAGLGLGLIPGIFIYLSFSRAASDEMAGREAVAAVPHFSLPSQEVNQEARRADELIDAALGQTDPKVRADALRQAGAVAAREDIRQALRLALTLSSTQDRLEFHRGVFGVWAEDDPQAALDHAHSTFEAGQLQSETIGIAINKYDGNGHGMLSWTPTAGAYRVDGIVLEVQYSTNLLDWEISALQGAVPAGLPAPPAGYEYVSFLLPQAVFDGSDRGFMRVRLMVP